MIFKEIEIKNAGGIGRIEAQTIVRRAGRFSAEIFFDFRTKKINAKSVMGIIAMGLRRGDKMLVVIKGDDEDDALTDIEKLFLREL
ncbi:MAG: HPr family phosphocarrier protein [Firmicutes bacterium]|nr:HPr family phosphocarrier protein [Bacillota bacterium]